MSYELLVGKIYRLGRKIGSGAFGDIYLGTDRRGYYRRRLGWWMLYEWENSTHRISRECIGKVYKKTSRCGAYSNKNYLNI